METEEGFTPRAVKGTISDVTVTVQRAYLSGFDLEATMMVTVPGDLPVTIPSADTVARLSSLEVHVNDLLVAFSGVTATVSCRVVPVATDTPPFGEKSDSFYGHCHRHRATGRFIRIRVGSRRDDSGAG